MELPEETVKRKEIFTVDFLDWYLTPDKRHVQMQHPHVQWNSIQLPVELFPMAKVWFFKPEMAPEFEIILPNVVVVFSAKPGHDSSRDDEMHMWFIHPTKRRAAFHETGAFKGGWAYLSQQGVNEILKRLDRYIPDFMLHSRNAVSILLAEGINHA